MRCAAEIGVPPEVKERVRRRLLDVLTAGGASEGQLESLVAESLLESGYLLPKSTVAGLASELSDELFGMGPLERLLRSDDVSEVMINGPGTIYIERDGLIERAAMRLENDAAVVDMVRRVIGPLNLRLDETSPMVDARLPDGSRLNAVIPPLCLNGPTVTIRKFRARPFTVEELVSSGTVSTMTAAFLREAVEGRANIIVSGGTSSGKTTLLNALSSFIPRNERLVTIEDAAELRIHHPHVISLESRPPSIEGRGEVTVRDLVRNALRMRPDRIIVGEVRGAETIYMLQAMNTGHPGSLTTAHANSPADVVSRLETMVLMSGAAIDSGAARRQISAAIDLVVHMERTRDGRRIVAEIASLGGTGDDIVLEPLVRGEAAGARA
jgi:pilus assembly protein CpaF